MGRLAIPNPCSQPLTSHGDCRLKPTTCNELCTVEAYKLHQLAGGTVYLYISLVQQTERFALNWRTSATTLRRLRMALATFLIQPRRDLLHTHAWKAGRRCGSNGSLYALA